MTSQVSSQTGLVLKFGGTSVGSAERISHAASIAGQEAKSGRRVAVVVSAMAGETDRLIGLSEALGGGLGEVETDTVLASGEQVSAALMALALKREGLKAQAVLSWQLPILVDGLHGNARIIGLDAAHLNRLQEDNIIPVIAGYQGLNAEGRLVTLGRGGTDLTAAAVAAALDSECDIYTDVDGVFTTDPRVEPAARRVERISHDEMLELAAQGAKVLQARSVEYAKAKGVTLRVKSSFAKVGESAGTEVVAINEIAERRIVSGVAYVRDQARVSIQGLDPQSEQAASLFAALADRDIGVDMIVQARSRAGDTVNLEFSVDHRDLKLADTAIHSCLEADHGIAIEAETGLAKVSVVGTGLRGRADVARTLYGVLSKEDIAVRMVATSEIKISALVDSDHIERAVRALHSAYGLDNA